MKKGSELKIEAAFRSAVRGSNLPEPDLSKGRHHVDEVKLDVRSQYDCYVWDSEDDNGRRILEKMIMFSEAPVAGSLNPGEVGVIHGYAYPSGELFASEEESWRYIDGISGCYIITEETWNDTLNTLRQ